MGGIEQTKWGPTRDFGELMRRPCIILGSLVALKLSKGNWGSRFFLRGGGGGAKITRKRVLCWLLFLNTSCCQIMLPLGLSKFPNFICLWNSPCLYYC